MQCLLVATDGSEGAGRAVDAAADLAAALNIELWIVTVMDGTPNELLRTLAREERITIGDALSALADHVLGQAKERSVVRGVKTVHLKSRSGDSAEEILETVREMGADAIFVGRRGLGRLQGLLLGSVSQKLASLAPCMVVIVP